MSLNDILSLPRACAFQHDKVASQRRCRFAASAISDSEVSVEEIEFACEAPTFHVNLADAPEASLVGLDDVNIDDDDDDEDSPDNATPTPFPTPQDRPQVDPVAFHRPLDAYVTRGEMEITDFEQADACGVGTYEHCGGFEEFDSDDEGHEFHREGPVFQRLYQQAKEKEKRLKVRQRAAKLEEYESDILTMKKGPNAKMVRISPRHMEQSMRYLSSTTKKDRKVQQLKAELEKREMRECTFAPRTHTLDRPHCLRSGSPDFATRLYQDAQHRAGTLSSRRTKLALAEKQKIEQDKRRCNKAYAERIRAREDEKKHAAAFLARRAKQREWEDS